MRVRIATLGLAALALGAFAAQAAQAQLAPALQYVIENNLATFNRKDLAGAMATIHTKSPDYDPTKAALEEQFKDLDATASLVKFDLIGHDDEFAVARVRVKTTGKPGSGFADNTVDAVYLFHQEDGAWKLWDETVLGIDILPQDAPAAK
ncbi:MAG: hypothetical protein U0802_13550 [Candidatus Binatia bacterium]